MGFFGLNRQEELERLQAEQIVVMEQLHKKIATYTQTMRQYEKSMNKIQSILEEYEAREHNSQMDSVQVALDLNYLKEQGEQLQQQQSKIEESIKTISEETVRLVRKQMDELKFETENLVNHQEITKEMMEQIRESNQAVKRSLFVTTGFGFLNLCGIIFMILYLLKVIVI